MVRKIGISQKKQMRTLWSLILGNQLNINIMQYSNEHFDFNVNIMQYSNGHFKNHSTFLRLNSSYILKILVLIIWC